MNRIIPAALATLVFASLTGFFWSIFDDELQAIVLGGGLALTILSILATVYFGVEKLHKEEKRLKDR